MRGWIICVILTAALTSPGPVRATTPEQMQAQIDALQAQVTRLQQQLTDLRRQLAEQNQRVYPPFSLVPAPPSTQPFLFGPIRAIPRRSSPYDNNTWHQVLPLETSPQQP